MENVTSPHSFQTLACDVFSEVVALFLAGSFLLPDTLGQDRVGNGQENYQSPGVSHSRTQAGHSSPVCLRE